jgi:uncharacterized protein involved in type VI secretion and phage assembly
VCTQYRASDLDFFIRLLADEELSFRFEHDQEGDAASATPSTSESKHRLVIFDAHAQAPAMPGVETLRFHGVRATDTMDAIAPPMQSLPAARHQESRLQTHHPNQFQPIRERLPNRLRRGPVAQRQDPLLPVAKMPKR